MAHDKHAFIYLRISEDRSGGGLGVDRQRDACLRLAEERGFTVLEVFEDNDISAYSGRSRPAYKQMLSRFDEVSYVVAWNSDRLHRNMSELEAYANACIEHSVLTHTVQGSHIDLSTPGGRLHARVFAAIASHESEIKAERTRLKVEQTILDGRHPGGPRPFGWDAPRTLEERRQKLGGRYEINEREAEAIREAVDHILKGGSMNSVVMDWNDPDRKGGPLLTTQGKPWHVSGFRRMLERPRNAGIITLRDEEVSRGKIPAILSYERWRRLRDFTAKRKGTGHGNKASTLGAGIITCHCGRPAKTWYTGNGKKIAPERVYEATYRCAAPKGTGQVHPAKRVEYVDLAIRLAVLDWFSRGPRIQVGELSPEQERRAGELETRLSDFRHTLEITESEYMDLKMGFSEYVRLRDGLNSRISKAEEELVSIRSQVTVLPSDPIRRMSKVSGMRNNLYLEWFQGSFDDRREFIRQMLEITILPTSRSAARVFDPATVDIRVKDIGQVIPAGEGTDNIRPGMRLGVHHRPNQYGKRHVKYKSEETPRDRHHAFLLRVQNLLEIEKQA